MKRTVALLALVVLLVGPRRAGAEDLRPDELADRLAHAKRSAHDALLDLEGDDEETALDALRKDGARLAGAKVRSGDETLDVDPGVSRELAGLDGDASPSEKRDRLARLERRLGALEREARRAHDAVDPAANEKPPRPGDHELRPATPRPGPSTDEDRSREVLSHVLDQPRYKKRTADAKNLGIGDKLESLEQRLENWWIRFLQPTPATPRPAWLAAIINFFAAILPATLWGWAILVTAIVAIIALLVWLKWRKNRPADDGRSRKDDGGLDGAGPGKAVVAEQSYSEDHWRREARLLARQGEYRGAIRALYTGVLLALQRAGRLKFDKGKTNWEHVRELRRNDRALAARLEPLTRTFDVAWYGQKTVEPGTFEAFLAEADAFTGATAGPGGAETPR